MQRVLITGGVGYIGSRLRKYLPEADSVDLELYGNPARLANRQMDYRSLTKTDIAAYDVVIHLAAHSSVAQCTRDPEGAVANNLTGFHQLMTLCKGKRLIYASSALVYGHCGGEPVTEARTDFQGLNRYDVSKYAMDLLAQTSDVACWGLRLGTVCGWSPNLRTDVMINRMVGDAMEHGIITVTNPGARRAILDIDDLCRTLKALVCQQGDPGIYNLTSFNDSVGNVAKSVACLCAVPTQETRGIPNYDTSMSCAKFREGYDFKFCGSVQSIVSGLIARPSTQGTGRL